MISRTNEYALRVMVLLASQEGKPRSTRQIADATQVPVSYLSKVLLELVKKGFIRSQRGLHGGFVLARDPAQVSVFDVISAIDPLPRIRACPLGLAAHCTTLCPLHTELDRAFEQVEEAFRRAKLAALIDPASQTTPCGTDIQTAIRARKGPRKRT